MSTFDLGQIFPPKVSIHPISDSACRIAREHMDMQTKPAKSLGRLEEIAERLAGMSYPPAVEPARLFTVAGDHGVAREGVSLFPQEVTRQMVANFLAGGAAINALTRASGMELVIVDAGCAGGPFGSPVVDARLGDGTANMCEGPAMDEATCLAGLANGARLAMQAVSEGCHCLAIGEMGIANSTSATALYSHLLDLPAEKVVGPGTGVDDRGMAHKAEVVQRAIEVNRELLGRKDELWPDPVAALSCLGGFEIVTMAGIVLGGAAMRVPVLVDGFIASSAYMAAVLLCPWAAQYCFVAHASAEPGHELSMKRLSSLLDAHFGQNTKQTHPWTQGERLTAPLLNLGMHLGEGTGCAVAYPLLRAAVAAYREMATFGEAGVSTADKAD